MANYALADYLARRGTELHLVGNYSEAALLEYRTVRFHRVPRPIGSFFLSTPFLDWTGRRWARRIAGRGGRVLVNGGNCLWGDANWVHYVHAAYRPEIATGVRRRAKGALERRRFLTAERRALRRARVIFANSERTRRHLVDLVGVPERLVHTVYYGIDASRFGPVSSAERAASREALGWPQDRLVVAFVGGLGDRRKGFDVLFDAWGSLCATPTWDADLAVVGAGAELPVWQQRACAKGIGDRIHFLGFTDRVPSVLAACDALVHPARYEAYGLGVQEALCRGLPAIVSESAGVAERYPDELRWLLISDPESPAELRERLLSWRGDVLSLARRVAPLAERLRAVTWDAMAAEMMATLEAAA